MRYPLVELACAALFAATAAKIGSNWDLPAMLVLIATLIALAIIDFEHLLLPRSIVQPATIAVLALLIMAAAAGNDWNRLYTAIICAMAWFGVFLMINLLSPRALGFGDVRLAPLLGLGLGWLGIWYAILGFFTANLLGAVTGTILVAAKRMDRNQRIPYAVFLALGSGVAIFAGSFMRQHLQQYL